VVSGRPKFVREVQARFWVLVREGMSTEDAAAGAGVSVTSGRRWFREAGGMCPPLLVPSGRYLSLAEREEIAVGVAAGEGINEMAERLGRVGSTISRELARNGSFRGHFFYRASLAQAKADRRGLRPKVSKLAARPVLCLEVQEMLTMRWSPEQISALLGECYPDDGRMQISHEAIYQALYVQGRGGLRRELHACLRTGRALREPRRRTDGRREHIKDKVMTSQRPAEVADRAVPGHWEGDLITGRFNASAIGTLVERTTRFTMLLHLPDNHRAEAVKDAITTAIAAMPAQLRRSLTWDQGLELSRHAAITVQSGLPIYFCDPHSPWQRGTNENTNGLLRQYFPKGPNCPATPRPTSTPWPPNSTADHAKPSAGNPRPKPSKPYCQNRPTSQVLRRPDESARRIAATFA